MTMFAAKMGATTVFWLSFVLFWSLAVAAERNDRLVNAVKQQDHSAVAAILQQGSDVNAPVADGATALHWAAHRDNLDIASLLVGAGANPNAVTDQGVTALALACINRSVRMAELLLKAGANPNAALETGETALMTAAWTGNADLVRLLLAHGASPNAKRSWNGQTALMWAASKGHSDVIRQLVTSGADVHAKTRDGFTPLHFAARNGDQKSAQLLLAAGSPINETASDGSVPLVVATVRGHSAFAAFLLTMGANPNASGTGHTALHWAAGRWNTELTGTTGIDTQASREWAALAGVPSGKLELIHALLAHGADPNARLEKLPFHYGYSQGVGQKRKMLVGATPFLIAAMSADVGVMRLLASNGADPRLVTQDGTTPLMVAAGLGRALGESRASDEETLRAVELAFVLGNDVHAVNDAGQTALHGAAHIRFNALIQILVNQGANVNVKDKRGDTPLMVAERTLQSGGEAITQRTSTGDLLRKLGAQ
jgi:ankyrin repeat protein